MAASLAHVGIVRNQDVCACCVGMCCIPALYPIVSGFRLGQEIGYSEAFFPPWSAFCLFWKIPGGYLNLATTAAFRVLSNSLLSRIIWQLVSLHDTHTSQFSIVSLHYTLVTQYCLMFHFIIHIQLNTALCFTSSYTYNSIQPYVSLHHAHATQYCLMFHFIIHIQLNTALFHFIIHIQLNTALFHFIVHIQLNTALFHYIIHL
jgi:hypothetical protein